MKHLLVALNAQYAHTSLALRLLSAACAREGIAPDALEAHINQPIDALLREIYLRRPDTVAFSCYIFNIDIVARLTAALRLLLPDCVIAWGGPEVTYDARDWLARTPALDYVLCGEGERTLPALLRALEAGESVRARGLTWREDGVPRGGELAPPVAVEDWADGYARGIAGIEDRILYVETSRGCPFRCGYCLSSLSPGVRLMDAHAATERLTRLADAGAALVKLVDRTFNCDAPRARAIWRALMERARVSPAWRVTFHFEVCAQLLTGDCLRLLAEAPSGLFQLEIGVQSATPGVLEAVERPVAFERIAEPVRALIAAGNMQIHLDLIAGLPGETAASFARSLERCMHLGAHRLQLGFLKLLRGSALRERAEALGIAYRPHAPYEVLYTRDMRYEDLLELGDVARALDWYWNSGRYGVTMRYLAHVLPFDALCYGLARALRDAGRLDAPCAEAARAEALHEYALSRGARADWLSACLRHDFSLAGRRAELPLSLRGIPHDARDAQMLREHARGEHGACVQRYDVDVLGFARDGALAHRALRVLYVRSRALALPLD